MENIFKNKKLNLNNLISYGFVKEGQLYVYSAKIDALQFLVKIFVAQDGKVNTKCYDENTGEEYTLYHNISAEGPFVGRVRQEIEALLKSVCEHCYDDSIFTFPQTTELIGKIKNTFGDDIEFLWDNYDGGIWRRKDTQKWYVLLQKIKSNSLFHNNCDDFIEIIDIRSDPDEIDRLVDDKKYFRGYHMNKKHWLTIILDGSVPMDEIMERIDLSYSLAKK